MRASGQYRADGRARFEGPQELIKATRGATYCILSLVVKCVRVYGFSSMIGINTKLIVLAALYSTASGFFLNWGSSNQEPNPPYPQYYYHQRVLHTPATYAEPVPTVPIGVPLQAQLAPTTIHEVQLVPCLCPAPQDYSPDKIVPVLPTQDYAINNQRRNGQ